MTTFFHILGSWLIVGAVILLLTPLPHSLSLTLGFIGGVLWSSAHRRREDILAYIIMGMVGGIFFIPLPLAPATALPLRLALVVGGWAVVISLTSAVIARWLQQKSSAENYRPGE